MTIKNVQLLLGMCTIPGTKNVPYDIASKLLRMTDEENLAGENKETVADFVKFLIEKYESELSDWDFLHFFLGHWDFLQFLLGSENKENHRNNDDKRLGKPVSTSEDYSEDCPEEDCPGDCENCVPSLDYIDRMMNTHSSKTSHHVDPMINITSLN